MNTEKRWLHGKLFNGQTVVILGQGPSFVAAEANLLSQHFPIIAIKDTAEKVPNASIIYAADKSWYTRTYRKQWLKDHTGIKVVLDYQKEDTGVVGLRYLHCVGKHGFSKEEGCVIHGRNSGHQAINLALNLGVRKIVLLGFDMCVVDGKTHFDDCPHVKVPHGVFRSFREELVQAVKSTSIPIVNCSLTTALKCFPIMTIQEAIWWGKLGGKEEL